MHKQTYSRGLEDGVFSRQNVTTDSRTAGPDRLRRSTTSGDQWTKGGARGVSWTDGSGRPNKCVSKSRPCSNGDHWTFCVEPVSSPPRGDGRP